MLNFQSSEQNDMLHYDTDNAGKILVTNSAKCRNLRHFYVLNVTFLHHVVYVQPFDTFHRLTTNNGMSYFRCPFSHSSVTTLNMEVN